MTCNEVSEGNPCSSISFGTHESPSATIAKSICVKFGSLSMRGTFHRAGMARFIFSRFAGSESWATIAYALSTSFAFRS